ncbi:MAG: transposase [Treponema sp.]|nr:transposase [Treponema sp.]
MLLEKNQNEMILDSSKTKESVNYCLNRWENLEYFIKYPETTFSTNAADRSSRMVFLLKIISDVFLKKTLMLKLKMTGKNFSSGILKLLHIRFVENGFKLWYNYVNVNSICGYLVGLFNGGF